MDATNLQMTTNKKILYPELSFSIVGACFDVHNELGRFAREKQYADLLEEKIGDRGLKYEREFRLGDSGNIVDFLVEEKILLELKTARLLTRDYYRQIQNYLQQSRIDLGLLINFSDTILRPRRILRISPNKIQGPHQRISTNGDSNSQSFANSDNSQIRKSHE
ncbi:MAG: GxxExxY protein [Patescibacteria group bacterium]|nr:GxxExxY protein [Patescibacteria group bacterium]